MPHDSSHSGNPRGQGPRAENRTNVRFVDMGVRNVRTGLRIQKEMLDTIQDIGHDWFVRATSEAELALKLPNRLTGARSVSDAFSAYNQWLNEWLSMCGEDGRRLVSDGQRLVNTGVRCLASATPETTR